MKKIMRVICVICLLSIFVSTKVSSQAEIISIKVRVEGKKIGKTLYLRDAYERTLIFDSAEYKNSEFNFAYKVPENFHPLSVSLFYLNEKGQSQILSFKNYVFPDEKLRATFFMLEKNVQFMIDGKIDTISHNTTNALNIKAGRQTEADYKLTNSHFTAIRTKDSVEREKIITRYQNIVDEYPFSYALLKNISMIRSSLTTNELNRLLLPFDKEVRSSPQANLIDLYAASILNRGKIAIPNLNLRTLENTKGKIIDTTAKLNMLVLWASWCIPCIKEIPTIKNLNETYGKLGVNIKSISIDMDNEAWVAAAKREKMPWAQYIVEQKDNAGFLSRFACVSIPTVIITDNKGLELGRFTEFDNAGLENCKTLLMQGLSNSNN